jgi:hypothetical protein
MQEKKELSYDRDRRKLGNRCGFFSLGRPTIVNADRKGTTQVGCKLGRLRVVGSGRWRSL